MIVSVVSLQLRAQAESPCFVTCEPDFCALQKYDLVIGFIRIFSHSLLLWIFLHLHKMAMEAITPSI